MRDDDNSGVADPARLDRLARDNERAVPLQRVLRLHDGQSAWGKVRPHGGKDDRFPLGDVSASSMVVTGFAARRPARWGAPTCSESLRRQ